MTRQVLKPPEPWHGAGAHKGMWQPHSYCGDAQRQEPNNGDHEHLQGGPMAEPAQSLAGASGTAETKCLQSLTNRIDIIWFVIGFWALLGACKEECVGLSGQQ